MTLAGQRIATKLDNLSVQRDFIDQIRDNEYIQLHVELEFLNRSRPQL